MKKIFYMLIILVIVLAVSFSYAVEFSDVPNTHWAATAIKTLADKGIINGYDGGVFKPGNTITRAEFIKLMVCTNPILIEGFEKQNNIPEDMFANWYDKYALAENLHELIPYYYDYEDYSKPITRREVAGIVERHLNFEGVSTNALLSEQQTADLKLALKNAGVELSYISSNSLSDQDFAKEWLALPEEKQMEITALANEKVDFSKYEIDLAFDDIGELEASDINAVNAMKYLGIVQGYEDGTYKPNNNITRAEVSIILNKFLEIIGG